MAQLNSGVLLNLLEQMSINENPSDPNPNRKPVLLQIRSIIPLLSDGDLWPNQGFFLKVSDSLHAIYVSLPRDQDDMILCNKLQLGQYIYVEELEAAYPVPMLKGITPVPGRHACIGTPRDLYGIENLRKFCNAFESGTGSVSTSKPQDLSEEESGERTLYCLPGSCRVDQKESDSENGISIPVVKRRSWNGREGRWSGESSESSSLIRHGSMPIGRRRRSACVSPPHFGMYVSSDESLSSKTVRKDGCSPKLIPSSNKKRISYPKHQNSKESLHPDVLKFNIVNHKTSTEAKIPWDSLPSTLVKLGKEVVKQREVALLAAVEALQEASAAQALLKRLSTYSELQLAKDKNLQPSVDKFLHFQEDLAHTRSIVESLTNKTPTTTTSDTSDSKDPDSINQSLKLASDRKKIATSWIKAALASDLAPISAPCKSSSNAATDTRNHGSKPKGSCIVKKHKDSGEIHIELAAEQEKPDWVKGGALSAMADLANSLQNECRKWFLGYVEQYLDGVKSKSIPMETDSQIAGMMCQIKRVNDWLDIMSPKIGWKSDFGLNSCELEVCGRVRSKIYGILLNQVERTALALENMDAIAQSLSIFGRSSDLST